MTPDVILALASMALAGTGDLVYRQAARVGLPTHRFMMVQTWVFAPTVIVYGLVSRTLVLSPVALLGAVAGLFAFAGLFQFSRSLRTGAVSINAPIFRLNFVITVLLASAFLGERLGGWRLLGVAAAMASVWLLVSPPAQGGRAGRRLDPSSLVRVLGGTVAMGVANLVYKIGLRLGATPAALLAVQVCLVTCLAAAVARATDGRFVVPLRAWGYAGPAGLVLALAFVTFAEGLARGPASVVVPIAQMGFVVATLVGVLALGEPFDRRRGLGLVAAIGAILLLARG